MVEQKIIVPIESSAASTVVPAGETVFYSATVLLRNMKMQIAAAVVGGIAGAAMRGATTYKTHMLLTEQNVIWDTKKSGPIIVPWSDVDMFMKFSMQIRPPNMARLTLVYDKKNSSEDKKSYKARCKTFMYDMMPLVISSLKSLIENAASSGLDEKDIKKRQKKLEWFEKLYAKLEKKMKK